MKFVPLAASWMDQEMITLNRVSQRKTGSQTQKNRGAPRLGISLWSIYPDKTILQKDTYPSKVIAIPET